MGWLQSLFTRSSTPRPEASRAPVLLHNTLTNTLEVFSSIKASVATLYSCGPTVYSRAHIGNLRPYVFSDVLARVLTEAGYHVQRVINITDVGHLVGDGDEGEDKMEAGSRREGKTARDIADTYTRAFFADLARLGVSVNDIRFPRATEYIPEQIALAQALEKHGLTYRTRDGMYFDTTAFAGYGAFEHDGPKLREEALASIGRRIAENKDKRHPADFALWKFSPPGTRRQQEWQSPWGIGFPGWHLECSAMVRALLGQPIDIHTGGIDHIPVHHTNEIAQSEGAYGKPLARYWMHSAFLTVDSGKISKSEGTGITLDEVSTRGIDPRALRYLFLQAHYRSPLSFTWESLEAAGAALERLERLAHTVKEEARGRVRESDASRRMVALLREDLATPSALALLWEVLKDEDMEREEQLQVLRHAEAVLGLGLLEVRRSEAVPAHIRALVEEREHARRDRDFGKADALRIHIESRGYAVEDHPSGPIVTRKPG